MGPDFLCIGAQKAGTTWLYECLRRHPDVWMPPIKEIHYFDRARGPEIRTLFVRSPLLRLWMRRRLSEAASDLGRHPSRAPWYVRAFAFPRNDNWYLSLFRPGAGRVSGDITPAYARLEAPEVEQVQRLLPGTKIIFLMRDPIERMWSQGAMFASRLGAADGKGIQENDLLEFLLHPTRLRNSAYDRALEIWESFFRPEQFFIGFYEDLKASPEGLLTDIYRFLSVSDDSAHARQLLGRKVNSRSYPPAPPFVRQALAKASYPTISRLHDRFHNEHTAAWLLNAKRALEGQRGD